MVDIGWIPNFPDEPQPGAVPLLGQFHVTFLVGGQPKFHDFQTLAPELAGTMVDRHGLLQDFDSTFPFAGKDQHGPQIAKHMPMKPRVVLRTG